MQTFLPYASFEQTAQCLDRQRLGKQRIECLQILQVLSDNSKIGWRNHPAVKMWKNSEIALSRYGQAICVEWKLRGYKDSCQEKIEKLSLLFNSDSINGPSWLGTESFHSSHRSNLLRKNYDWYKQFNWKEPTDLPYVWPI